MEGKEVRFGASGGRAVGRRDHGDQHGCGERDADSLTPLGGLVPLFLMLLGEITPGGVGAACTGCSVFALLTVFIAGLMVGEPPSTFGKKSRATR